MGKKRILVCDDHKTILQLLSVGLQQTIPAEVITIDNGVQLMEYLENPPHIPDILILDLMLPGLEGDDAIRRIRKDERYEKTPIILMSGVIVNLDTRAESVGANDYIKKPFSILTLKEKILPYL